jgi:ankyrin repeat protein
MCGHTKAAELLVAARRTNVDAATRDGGVTALTLATHTGLIEVVKALLHVGADINKADAAGQTPIYLASQRGDKQIVELLLKSPTST